MRNITIITASIIALTTTAAADKLPTPKRMFLGVNAGLARTAAEGNRIAASGWGAAFRGEFGFRLIPSVALPYVTGGVTWGRGDAPEWESEGYKEFARYLGLYTTQFTVGGYYRQRLKGDALAAYGGPAFLAVWQRREAITWYGAPMDKTFGSGLGWAAVAGVAVTLGPGHTLNFQLLYGQANSAWSDLPAGADEDFVFEELQIGGSVRFFLF